MADQDDQMNGNGQEVDQNGDQQDNGANGSADSAPVRDDDR